VNTTTTPKNNRKTPPPHNDTHPRGPKLRVAFLPANFLVLSFLTSKKTTHINTTTTITTYTARFAVPFKQHHPLKKDLCQNRSQKTKTPFFTHALLRED
jgi:hypothetical protein